MQSNGPHDCLQCCGFAASGKKKLEFYIKVVPIRNLSHGNRSNLKISQESRSTPHPDWHAQIGNPAAPILAAQRAPLPTMCPPFRPSLAVTQKSAPQISPGDAYPSLVIW